MTLYLRSNTGLLSSTVAGFFFYVSQDLNRKIVEIFGTNE